MTHGTRVAMWYAAEAVPLETDMSALPIAIWSVVAALVAALAWSLLWDRSRGRLRCPKCWYTIDEPTRAACPECGRAFAHERQLRKTRRHAWRSISIGLGLALAVYVATCVESIRRDGWLGVVPTIALVVITDGEEAWKWQGVTPPNSATAVLIDRMKEHRSSLWSRRLWAGKAASTMPEIPPPRMPIELEPTVVHVYDLSAFAPLFIPRPADASRRQAIPTLASLPIADDFHPRGVWAIVISTCRFGAWASSGGVEARGELIGDQLIVRASESHHEEIAEAIAVVAGSPRRVGEPVVSGSEKPVLVRYELPRGVVAPNNKNGASQEMLRFRRELQEQNRKELWQAWGGMEAQLHIFRGTFVIETTPDHHIEIAAYIDAKAAERSTSGR